MRDISLLTCFALYWALSLCLCLFLSPSVYVSVCLSLSLYISLSLSLSASLEEHFVNYDCSRQASADVVALLGTEANVRFE